MARHRVQLTPEEKHRIYLEEKVRFQVQKRIRRESTKRRLGLFFGLGALCVLVMAIVVPERDHPKS